MLPVPSWSERKTRRPPMSIGLASWPASPLSTRVKSGSSPAATQRPQPAHPPRKERAAAGGARGPAAGAAPVALPVGRVAALPGQQGGRGGGQREVVNLAARQGGGGGT